MDGTAIFQMVQYMATMIANIEECGFEQSVTDIVLYCKTNVCSMDTFVSQIAVKGFQLLDKINQIVEVAQAPLGQTPEAIFDQAEIFGKAIGGIIRLLIGIEHL